MCSDESSLAKLCTTFCTPASSALNWMLCVMKHWIVLIIALGLILACDGTNKGPESAKQAAAKLGTEALGALVTEYHGINGKFPSEWNQMIGLRFPGGNVRFRGMPLDPWSHEYMLVRSNGDVTIVSLGKDGMPGGVGYDLDISHLVEFNDASKTDIYLMLSE